MRGAGPLRLVAPARWRASEAGLCEERVDWSLLVAPPDSGVPPRVAAGVIQSDLTEAAWRGAARRGLQRLQGSARQAAAQAVQWIEVPASRRPSVHSLAICAGFSAVVLLGMGIAHSNTEPRLPPVQVSPLASLAQASQPQLATIAAPHPPTAQPAATPAAQLAAASAVQPAAPSSADAYEELAAPPAIAPAALLSEASTMDLLMPIAEPDLDIASRQSLWAQVGRESGVDPLLLYSIALVESRALFPAGNAAPTPWLFRVNDHLVLGGRQHVQLAMAAAGQFGSPVQDVGIMQVYYPAHRGDVHGPLDLLDPRTNISVAARILRDGMRRTSDPVLGVGYYHSHTPQLARTYGSTVMTVYQRLKLLYPPGRRLRIATR